MSASLSRCVSISVSASSRSLISQRSSLDVKKYVYESWHNDNLLVFWAVVFFRPYYCSSCENKRNPSEAKGKSNPQNSDAADKARVSDKFQTQIRVKAQG